MDDTLHERLNCMVLFFRFLILIRSVNIQKALLLNNGCFERGVK